MSSGTELPKWRRGFELITSNIKVDATDDDGEEEEIVQCNCPKPYRDGFCCMDEKCVNFATQTECVDCWPGCQNQRFKRRSYARLDIVETKNKGFGLFAIDLLPPRTFVYEYLGELISLSELTRRMRESSEERHLYAMQISPRTYLDSRKKGSVGRFINHSCEPNCLIEIWSSGGCLKVGIFTSSAIEAGGELTFDYQWPPNDRPPTVCHCGTPSCRGTLEVYPKRSQGKGQGQGQYPSSSSDYHNNMPLSPAMARRRGQWRPHEEIQAVLLALASMPAQDLAPIPALTHSNSNNDNNSSSGDINNNNNNNNNSNSNNNSENDIQAPSTPSSSSSLALVSDAEGGSITGGVVTMGDWLVGKQIRVWWESNQRFFVADVLAFKPAAGTHTLKYHIDGQVSEECMWSHLLPDPNITSPTAAAASSSSSSFTVKREDQDRQGFGSGHMMDVDAGGSSASSAGSGAPPVDVITNSLWQWLDETREEVTIKRKGDAGYDQTAGLDSCLVDQDLEYDEDEWMFREGQRQAQEREAAAAAAALLASSQGSQEGGGNVGYTQGARKLRSTVPVSLTVAMEVFRESSLATDSAGAAINPSGAGSVGMSAAAGGIGANGVGVGVVGGEAVSASQAWGALSEWLMRQYQVKAFPPNNTSTTSTSSGSGGGSYDHPQQQVGMVVLFGDQSNVDRSKHALTQLAEEHLKRVSRQQTSVTERLRARQGAGLTYDWRVLPAATTNNNNTSGNASATYQSGSSSGGSDYSNSGYSNTGGNGGGSVLSVDLLLRQVCAMSSSSSLMAARGWPSPQELSSTAGATTTLIYDRKSALACLAFTNQSSTTHSAHSSSSNSAAAAAAARDLAGSLQLAIRQPTASGNTSSSSGGGAGGGVTEPVRRSLLLHLRGLVKRFSKNINMPGATALHAATLLMRYLSPHACPALPHSGPGSSSSSSHGHDHGSSSVMVTDATVADTTSVVAAALALALRARGAFKPKMLRKIVQSAYCQVG